MTLSPIGKMNSRILELLKKPEIINIDDLKHLESEIKTHPYIQSIRLLQLYGINKFAPENYQAELSKTAAYTTDKKIIYQFINKGEKQPEKPNAEKIASNSLTTSNQEIESPPAIHKNQNQGSELNKLPENHLVAKEKVEDAKHLENIDFDNTDISKNESKNIDYQNLKEEEIAEEIQKDKVINEDKISKINEPEEVEKSSELSFQGANEFLPEIKLPTNHYESINYKTPKENTNKHHDEMQRLIAEVEAKMKASPMPKTSIDENHGNRGINFVESHDSVTISTKKTVNQPEIEEKSAEIEKIVKTIETEIQIEQPKHEWKPMQISANLPDSVLSKKESKSIKTDEKLDKIEEIQPKTIQNHKNTVSKASDDLNISEEKIPVMNVSFFSQNVSPIATEIKNEVQEKTEDNEVQKIKKEDSNVPLFINTWQSWLKLDRKENAIEPINKQEISAQKTKNSKTKIIENFIENNPKISKFKDTSDFVAKEKNDNISHLMTETLAKLYIEQKLYSKAIKAYEILSQKHPEKSENYSNQIQKIKELRSKN